MTVRGCNGSGRGVRDMSLPREAIERCLPRLAPPEREVIALRLGLTGSRPATVVEVARRTGRTSAEVRRIESIAMSKLRHPSMGALALMLHAD